jgi:small conductance mechanosensitive channel
MRGEPAYKDVIRGSLNVLGVDSLEASRMIVKMYVETQPGRQWEAGRELRRRIVRACDEAGISISAG